MEKFTHKEGHYTSRKLNKKFKIKGIHKVHLKSNLLTICCQ